ncbi:iron uptake transporter deferrochelatase/peroxidase subunit [Actinacidiphila bryophytorum]|uniref:Deferrochelatase n=1 Tax=Actinacidiphila bryophytorum TaxID=1436133 RepID=A0A9W4H4Z0_9ACTN|nr:iron uptake transporter deferrochelatase/peroxidase subunit [Actinacidiphila bryophytorum]CAG7651083.1 Dye-decolorizing peroxidase Tfu_3078 [Actinacidiphila bryophytorum]
MSNMSKAARTGRPRNGAAMDDGTEAGGAGAANGAAIGQAEANGVARSGARPRQESAPISRRRLLGTAGAAGAAGLMAGGAAGAGVAAAVDGEPVALATVGSAHIPFEGAHQAGIVQPAQARGHLVAFDLVAGADRKDAAALLRRWSDAVRTMTAADRPSAPAAYDDQVAYDAGPSSLTVTFGFGRSFFGRTGLGSALPEALAPLPDFAGDRLDAARSNGDLWVQIGADDALVAFHALRVLQKAAGGTAAVRWQMNGFNRTPGAAPHPMTGRNLMGQIDGTNNPKPSDPDFARRVFVPAGGSPGWMAGGSYAVVRRIRMLLDDWDHLAVARQEKVIGRRKSDGAPLSGGTEFTPVDLAKFNADGSPAIAGDAHVRVAAPASNGGAAMLRRAFSYHDGIDQDGTPDAGLLFVAWQADPLKGFVPVQRKLDGGDGLSRFLRHESSGLFAVPGGVGRGEYVGQRLLEG